LEAIFEKQFLPRSKRMRGDVTKPAAGADPAAWLFVHVRAIL